MKNKIRPLKFDKLQEDGKLVPVNPRLVKKFILSENNQFIAFSNQAYKKDLIPIKEMLKNFQYNRNKIIELTFCNLCLDEKKFTLLREQNQIKSFNDKIVCSECALKIVLREIELVGLISNKRISPKLKNFFNHMILKFKDIKKVISVFQSDFNPVVNREITLYDIEKNPPISKKYFNIKIENIEIPNIFKEILKNNKIFTLLPIQAIAIEYGLLSERRNMLIMAPTSGGKTLIGEIAGISKVLSNKKKKMLYLVPIVALANIRTEEFQNKYKPLKLKIVKKVGESFFERPNEKNDEELFNAEIIIATYEAIDYILRSGNKEMLGDIGTIIIDEIQTLIDPERGFLLDGFIARLKLLYKESQFLYLSATIGEPKELAEKLNCVLVQYNNRPVPIERHLLLCINERTKQRYIYNLVKESFLKRSNYGFKGQSIIFTNTRKKCENITLYLKKKGLNVRAYHSGLTNEERKIIEREFQLQKIAGVVATAALAAGVDLPANQVIFESLAMGINWLTVAEFEQMLGRAGRLKKHNLGRAYLLVEPGKIYSPKMKKITEENIAIKLLKGKIKDFELPPNENKSISELLAFISIFTQGVKKEKIYEFYEFLINNDYDLEVQIKKLISLGLIRGKENYIYKSTRLGMAIAKSFLTVNECLDILNIIKKDMKPIIDIALDLKPIKNVYLSKKIIADLSKNVNMKYFSNNLFSASVLSLMNADYVKKRKKFSQELLDFIIKLINDIFNCDCKDNPNCDCGKLNIERLILNLRIKSNLSIENICSYLESEYKILIFKGDIIDYLENLIYSLESIKNISQEIHHLKKKQEIELMEIPLIVEKIKY
ncbi:MAG: DEAD/DEAH box helicase [Promethearchaeota archaeon]